jgi:hypothetical protein
MDGSSSSLVSFMILRVFAVTEFNGSGTWKNGRACPPDKILSDLKNRFIANRLHLFMTKKTTATCFGDCLQPSLRITNIY